MEGTSQAVLGSSSQPEGTGQPVDYFFLPLSFRFKIFFLFLFMWDIQN
jgi:hypothetical protein